MSTQDDIAQWVLEERRAATFRSQLASAEAARDEVGQRIAEGLAPNDMKVGEVIAVWGRVNRDEERLFQITLIEERPTSVGAITKRKVWKVGLRGQTMSPKPEAAEGPVGRRSGPATPADRGAGGPGGDARGGQAQGPNRPDPRA